MKKKTGQKISENNKITDSFLNIIASLILTVTLQIIIHPMLASSLTISNYGNLLTVMGIINTLSVSIGSTLNNTRLLNNNKYRDKKINGDFNYIFLYNCIVIGLLFVIILTLFFSFSFFDTILLMLIVLFIAFRSYYSVAYRLIINYKKILLMNVYGAIGYMVGLIVYKYFGNWPVVFLVGELFSAIYIISSSNLYKEQYQKTVYYNHTKSDYNYLLSSSLIGNAASYMDRFLVNPLIGGEGVAIYSVASMLGKVAGIIVNPINGVLLSHYVNEKILTLETLIKRIMISLVSCMLIFLGIILTGRPLLEFLYPNIIDLASNYFFNANLAAIVLIFGNTLQPLIFRFANLRWQPILQIFYLAAYLLFSILGFYFHGFPGFISGVLFANVFRAIFMIVILYISVKKIKKVN